MQFRIEIQKVQHIEQLSLELDLATHKLTCLVGRNGIGKTTLVRALKNLSQSDTFLRTAPSGIFSTDSAIRYWIDREQITFEFDQQIGSLNCKKEIPQWIRVLCAVELPIPYGDRFNFFQSISKADRDIRRQIILEEYSSPTELVEFLTDIYSSDKFQSLIETKIRGHSYFNILLDDGRYVREDYLSSGEFFLIHLYRMIRGSADLIVVDEIDISLDAAAQVRLLHKLREYCNKYSCNILFTTHSLAMMRTLNESELFYMERIEVETALTPVSYSYIKSILFGFRGWDRYILTEDIVLRNFLIILINRHFPSVFFEYKIIYIDGGKQVVDLLIRNRCEQFLSGSENVIAVLDGDQSDEKFSLENSVYCLPFESVEKTLLKHYVDEDFPHKLAEGKKFNGPKDLFNSLLRDRVMSTEMINQYLCDKYEGALEPLLDVLREFLSQG